MSQFELRQLHKGKRLVQQQAEENKRVFGFRFPDKKFNKNWIVNASKRMEKRMGYDYQIGQNKAMNWMKEQFNNKLEKYLANRGSREYAQKMTRMDKVKIKEQIDFKLQTNPLVKIFSRVNNKMEKGLLWDGFRAITN